MRLSEQTTSEIIPFPIAQNMSGPGCDKQIDQISAACSRSSQGTDCESITSSDARPMQQNEETPVIPDCTLIEDPRLLV
jgi:hypothetical protein